MNRRPSKTSALFHDSETTSKGALFGTTLSWNTSRLPCQTRMPNKAKASCSRHSAAGAPRGCVRSCVCPALHCTVPQSREASIRNTSRHLPWHGRTGRVAVAGLTAGTDRNGAATARHLSRRWSSLSPSELCWFCSCSESRA